MVEPYQAPAGGSRQWGTLCLLLSCPRFGTGGSWPPLTVWALSHPSTSSSGLLCSSYQVSPSGSQFMAGLGLHQSPSQETPESTHLVAGRHQSLLGQISLHGVSSYGEACSPTVMGKKKKKIAILKIQKTVFGDRSYAKDRFVPSVLLFKDKNPSILYILAPIN